MTKKNLINALINDDINNIMTGDCNAYLDNILRTGFVGYSKQTITELKQEYKERELENSLDY